LRLLRLSREIRRVFCDSSVIDSVNENQISRIIYEKAIEVHKELGGPGLLESVYEEALAWELTSAGLFVRRQRWVPINYKAHKLQSDLRLDLCIDNKVIVECKSTIDWHPVFEMQVLTYLRLTGLKLGLLINFGEALVKNGVKRIVNNL